MQREKAAPSDRRRLCSANRSLLPERIEVQASSQDDRWRWQAALARPTAVSLVLGTAALWWMLTDGRLASLVIGGPTLAFAAWLALGLNARPGRLPRPRGLARLAGFFLVQSVLGALAVARLVLRRRIDHEPTLVAYRTRLSDPRARAWYMSLVTMLPGTLTAKARGPELTIHVLDRHGFDPAELTRLEDLVEGAFPEARAGRP